MTSPFPPPPEGGAFEDFFRALVQMAAGFGKKSETYADEVPGLLDQLLLATGRGLQTPDPAFDDPNRNRAWNAQRMGRDYQRLVGEHTRDLNPGARSRFDQTEARMLDMALQNILERIQGTEPDPGLGGLLEQFQGQTQPVGPNLGPPPPGAQPMSDPTRGSPGEMPPSDLNQWIQELGGYEGNLPGRGQTGPGPSPGILRHMQENAPLNQGLPPGPEMVGPGPGLGLGNPDLMAPQPLPLGPQPDVPEGFSIQAPTPEAGQALSPETMEFLAALLERRPELMAMQGPSSPTQNQDAQMLAVALELINEQQAVAGQPPLMPPDVGQGAQGLRAFSESRGNTPQHTENIMGKAAREARGVLGNLPDFLQELLAPDAAQRIAENPRGRLTPRAQQVLQQPGPPQDLGSAQTEQQRTDQLNFLLAAGPERSSLLGNLGPGESALAAQMGGLPEFATQGGMARPDPASQDYESRTGLTPMLERPFTSGGKTPEQIAESNRGFFAELMSQILPEWGARPGEQPRFRRSPQEPYQPSLLNRYIGELNEGAGLTEQILGAQGSREMKERQGGFSDVIAQLMAENRARTPGSFQERRERTREFGRLTRAEERFIREAGRFDFPPEVGAEPEYATPLDRALAEGNVASEFEMPPAPTGRGTDVLEGKPGQEIGLDEAGNIRLGGPGGQIITSRPVDLGPSTPIDTNVPDLEGLLKVLGGMRQVDLGPLPKGPGMDVGMQMPGMDVGGGGMMAPELPQVPGGMRPFPGGNPMPETPPPGLDFLQFLLGPAGMALGRR